MQTPVRLSLAAMAVVASGGFAFAQSVISAHSGVVHYVQGRVLLNDQVIDGKFGNFPAIPEKQLLRTEQGRAEVLLTPGVFLRLGENTAIRMISNRLIDTRVDFLSGSIMLEAADLPKDNAVTIVYKDYIVGIPKKGVYAFESDPAALRVYQGEALAQLDGKSLEVKDGKVLAFDGQLALEKFDNKDPDSLYAWSRRRSESLAAANIYAAKSVADSDYQWQTGQWMLNPLLGMYSYIPANGIYYSPFGYAFWSPYTVYQAYNPYYYGSGYAGGGGVGRSTSGGSGNSAGYSKYNSRGNGHISPTHGPVSTAVSSGYSHGGGGNSGGSFSQTAPAVSVPVSHAGSSGGSARSH